jgi:hypothetical protein
MDTNTHPDQTQAAIASSHTRPIRDAISDEIKANAESVRQGLLQYVSEVFRNKDKPLAHTRIVLGMCMQQELGGDKDRKKFLRIVFDVDGTSQLDHLTLSALYHFVKPFIVSEQQDDGTTKAVWYANEASGKAMRAAVREDLDGTWTTDDGNPSTAIW